MNEQEAIKNLTEIVELSKEEIKNNNKNISATLDFEDLKSLGIVLNLLKEEDEKIKRLKIINHYQSKDIKKSVDYIFELNKEIEKKEKIIDLMAEYLTSIDFDKHCEEVPGYCLNCPARDEDTDGYMSCIKNYFESKVETEDK